MPQKKIFIEGMHCRSCELVLEDDLAKVPGVTKVEASFKRGEARLSYTGSAEPNEQAIQQIIEDAGYHIGQKGEALPWFSRSVENYGRFLFAVVGLGVLALLFDRFNILSLPSIGNVDVSNLSFVFLIGLTAGISTCAALVGGLVLATAARYNALHPELSAREKFIPHFWFQLGRVGGFFVFGVLLGFVGDWFGGSIIFTALLTLLAGGVMLLLGLQLSELFPRLSRFTLTLPKGLARLLGIGGGKEAEYSHRGTLIAGALTFFLPCGFTQAVQLAVVALGQPIIGGIVMATFALGTMPGLLALGGFATFLEGKARTFLFPLIAVVLIAFGGWNLSNGLHLFGVDTSLSRPVTTGGAETAPLENGVQVVRIIQDSRGYHPATLPTLQAGIPARLIIDSQDSYTCASSFVIPAFGIRKQLVPGENIIEFTPKKDGRLPFSCSMGMFRGEFDVIE